MNILDRFNIKETSSPIELPILREGFDKLLAEMNLNEGCEVGVLTGRHAKKMMDANLNLHLHLVDSYKFYKGMLKRHHDVAEYLSGMRRRLAGYNCTEHIEYSMDAVRKFEDDSLDFVHIDSNHNFDYVMQDLIEWSRKVRKGGIISGHDYIIKDVNQAVHAYIKAHDIEYYFITSGNQSCPDRTKTFFWIKE